MFGLVLPSKKGGKVCCRECFCRRSRPACPPGEQTGKVREKPPPLTLDSKPPSQRTEAGGSPVTTSVRRRASRQTRIASGGMPFSLPTWLRAILRLPSSGTAVLNPTLAAAALPRSGERRVWEEGRCRWVPYHLKK